MSIMKINSGIEIDTKNNFLLAEVIDTSTNSIYLISKTELETAKEVGDSKVIEMLNEYDALEDINNIVNYAKNNNIGNFALDLEGNNLTVEQYCLSYRAIKQIDDSNKYIPQKSMIGSHLTIEQPTQKQEVQPTHEITSTDFTEDVKVIENTEPSQKEDDTDTPMETELEQYSTNLVKPALISDGEDNLDALADKIFKSSKKEDEFYLGLIKQYTVEDVIDNVFELVSEETIIDKAKIEKFQTILMEDSQYSEIDVRKLAGKVYSLFAKHLIDLVIIDTDKQNKLDFQVNQKTTPIVENVVEGFEQKIEEKANNIVGILKLKYNISGSVEEVLYDNIIKKMGGK